MSDLISRQDAIELLSEMRSRYNCFDESERQFYEALSMAIEALSCSEKPNELQPPRQGQRDGGMIYRQDAIDALDKRFDDVPEELIIEILQLRRDLRIRIPSAEPEREKGEWIDKSGGIDGAWNYCSVCGEQAIDLYDFCPNCGCQMTRGEEDEHTD